MDSQYYQSSCIECPPPNSFFVQEEKNPVPTNLGISNCQKAKGLDCYSKQLYKTSIQPQIPHSTQYRPLNVLGVQYEDEYTKNENCGYNGRNPLLIDAMRGIQVPLDRPHFTGELAVGNVEHDEIYTPKIREYGRNYRNYSDIRSGNVQYYTIDDTKDAYFQPNFVTPAEITHTLRQDPMGNFHPEYNRNSMKQYSFNGCDGSVCDSYTHDSLEFRQELMEKQMRKYNSQRYESRWY